MYVVTAVVGVAAAFVDADVLEFDALLPVCVGVAADAIADVPLDVVLCCADESCCVVSTTLDAVPPAAAFMTANSGMTLNTLAESTADRIVRYLFVFAFVAIESLLPCL